MYHSGFADNTIINSLTTNNIEIKAYSPKEAVIGQGIQLEIEGSGFNENTSAILIPDYMSSSFYYNLYNPFLSLIDTQKVGSKILK